MNKTKLFFGMLIVSNLSFALESVIGRISDIKGSGFISYNGKTEEIRKGTIVYLNSEIVVEHNGQVTYTDNADHRFYLGNATTAAVTKDGFQLRSGDVWLQSLNKSDKYKLTTTNGIVEFDGGEAVVTYDTTKGKTQLMVINGLMKLANYRTPDLNVSVSEGNFSYVDTAYDEGAPRDPTPVGEKTYKALIGEFNGVSPLDKNSEKIFKANESSHGSREIASVKEEPKHEVKKEEKAEASHGEKVAVTEKKDANSHELILEEYKNSMLEKKSKVVLKKANQKEYAKATHSKAVKVVAPVKSENSPLVVHIYGQKKIEKSPENIASSAASNVVNEKQRAPASATVPEEAVVTKAATSSSVTGDVKNENKIDSETKYINDQRTKETEKLIERINKL